MAKEFRLPDIGEGLTEAEIVRWLIPVGERVEADEVAVEVETDKAVVEIPSPHAGTVLFHGAAEGETIEVGEILLVVGDADEAWPPEAEAGATETSDSESTEEPRVDDEPPQAWEAVDEDEPLMPAVPAPIVGSLNDEAEELLSRSQELTENLTTTKALPLVRKLAKDLGVGLESLSGSGPHGRITRDDVLAAAEEMTGGEVTPPPPPSLPPVPGQPPAAPASAGSTSHERRPMSKLRRTIAANMSESWRQIPHVTTFDEVDATRLMAVREALGRRHGNKVPIEALVVKALTPVLAEFPEFNSSLEGDDLVLHPNFDIGIAVDTPEGLLVAVIRDAGGRSVTDLAGEVSRLGAAAKERKLGSDELTGQTFTVSNIGAVGGGFGTPIVPPGTVAILSVGQAVDKPVVIRGRVEIAPLIPLSLSYDHRVIDGGAGRRFMAMLLENLEEPGLFLAE